MNVNTLNHQSDLFQTKLLNTEVTSDVYYQGELPARDFKNLGIIGTRRPTPYGISMVKSLTESLRGYKINVISGLAIGIDSLAHRQALLCDLPTTAVVPSDLDHIYPPRHIDLAQEIISSGGALVSLHRSPTKPHPGTFHERNQLLAAMCDAIVVIEAAKRSGTMITVRFGLTMGKPILALPGRVGDALSFGTNHLIAQGAIPLLSAQDIIDVLGLTPKQQNLFVSPEHSEIIRILDGGINEINQVQQFSELNPQQFNSLITDMELDGVIRIEAGRIYKRGLA